MKSLSIRAWHLNFDNRKTLHTNLHVFFYMQMRGCSNIILQLFRDFSHTPSYTFLTFDRPLLHFWPIILVMILIWHLHHANLHYNHSSMCFYINIVLWIDEFVYVKDSSRSFTWIFLNQAVLFSPKTCKSILITISYIGARSPPLLTLFIEKPRPLPLRDVRLYIWTFPQWTQHTLFHKLFVLKKYQTIYHV